MSPRRIFCFYVFSVTITKQEMCQEFRCRDLGVFLSCILQLSVLHHENVDCENQGIMFLVLANNIAGMWVSANEHILNSMHGWDCSLSTDSIYSREMRLGNVPFVYFNAWQ